METLAAVAAVLAALAIAAMLFSNRKPKSYRVRIDEPDRQASNSITNPELQGREQPPLQPHADIIKALQAGNNIEAIKLYRDIHGFNLAEAKRAVDALAEEYQQP